MTELLTRDNIIEWIKKNCLTSGDLIDIMIKYAQDYTPGSVASIKRNKHMNNCEQKKIDQDVVDAVIVDYLNYVASRYGIDLGLYVKDLREKR